MLLDYGQKVARTGSIEPEPVRVLAEISRTQYSGYGDNRRPDHRGNTKGEESYLFQVVAQPEVTRVVPGDEDRF